jgi:hypothetical protein
MADVPLGSDVRIEVVKRPSNAAARKTIVRLLSKDEQVQQTNARLRRSRAKNAYANQRGGRVRVWAGRQVKLRPVTGEVGEAGTVRATYDVVRDLQSVEPFVKIEPATATA